MNKSQATQLALSLAINRQDAAPVPKEWTIQHDEVGSYLCRIDVPDDYEIAFEPTMAVGNSEDWCVLENRPDGESYCYVSTLLCFCTSQQMRYKKGEVPAELERLIVKNAVLQRYSYYTRHAALEEAAVLCDKSFIHTGKDIAAAVRNLKHKEPLI